MPVKREPEQRPGSRTPSAPVPPRPAPGATDRVLSLQRTAGNHATLAALSGATRPTLARVEIKQWMVSNQAAWNRITGGATTVETTRLTAAQRRELLDLLKGDTGSTTTTRKSLITKLEAEVERDEARGPSSPPTTGTGTPPTTGGRIPSPTRPPPSLPGTLPDPSSASPPRDPTPTSATPVEEEHTTTTLTLPSSSGGRPPSPARMPPRLPGSSALPSSAATLLPPSSSGPLPLGSSPPSSGPTVGTLSPPTTGMRPPPSSSPTPTTATPPPAAANPALLAADVGAKDVLLAGIKYWTPDEASHYTNPSATVVTNVRRNQSQTREVLLAGKPSETPEGGTYSADDKAQPITVVQRNQSRTQTFLKAGHAYSAASGGQSYLPLAQERLVTETSRREEQRVGAPVAGVAKLRSGNAFKTADGTGSYQAFRNDVQVTVVSADETNVQFNYTGVDALLTAPRAAILQAETIVRFRQSDGNEYKVPAAAVDSRVDRYHIIRVGSETRERRVAIDAIGNETRALDHFKRTGTDYVALHPAVEVKSAGFRAIEGGIRTEEELFPSGSPSPEDIHQSNLGDCYLQAVMVSVATQDPGQLRRMMTPHGDRVTVRFYTKGTGPTATLQPQDITVEASLPTDATGTPLYNKGAHWARLMQKAYAVFAQTHGQYGVGFEPLERAARENQGYKAIGGGTEYKLYQVFYGPKLQVAEITNTGYDAAASDLGVSLPAINKLIAQSATTGPVTLLTAASSSLPLVRRAQTELALVTAPPADFKVYFDNLKIYLDDAERALVAEPRRVGGARPDEQVPDVRALRDNANSLTSDKLVPQINRSAASRMLSDIATSTPALKPIHQLLLDLREIGVDTSARERFIYGGHAYSIVGAQIMIGGRAATAPVAQADLARLNVDASNVTLRNPHHGNVPTEREGQGQPEGQFRLTLREFLRHFTQLDSGEVERR